MVERLGEYTNRLIASRRTRPLIRAMVASGRAQHPSEVAAIARGLYPSDKATLDFVTRGVVPPTDTTTGAALAQTVVSDIVSILGPATASGALFAAAIGLNFDRNNGITVPTITASPSGIKFIAQGAAYPVFQLVTGGPTLSPKKTGVIIVLSRELFIHSNAETILRAAMSETLSLGVEAMLFDNVAGDAVRPAGLLYNVPMAAAAASGPDAMIEDLTALGSAVAKIGGLQIAFVASPDAAIKISLRTNDTFKLPVFASGALADRTIVAIALPALAVAGGAPPRFEIADQAVLHMEDTNPAQIVAANGTVAAPTSSIWQFDRIAFRVVLEIDYALRVASGGVAWTQGINW